MIKTYMWLMIYEALIHHRKDSHAKNLQTGCKCTNVFQGLIQIPSLDEKRQWRRNPRRILGKMVVLFSIVTRCWWFTPFWHSSRFRLAPPLIVWCSFLFSFYFFVSSFELVLLALQIPVLYPMRNRQQVWSVSSAFEVNTPNDHAAHEPKLASSSILKK